MFVSLLARKKTIHNVGNGETSLQIIQIKCHNKLQPNTFTGEGRYLRYRVPSEGLGFSSPRFLLWCPFEG